MLRVTVELVPQGREDRKRTLVVGTIANMGKDPRKGTYKIRLYDVLDRPYRSAVITGWPRTRRHVWQLVREALDAALRTRRATSAG